ncbi:hypothetical protein E2C01_040289 [Portunus trituberculatus]|uniref:Uncharacterized protein n=1 Tax=Portunus trituberculatus TaxID=210409 RepID=A0A5B7FML1_PORTR|nr:hypothetical protein [Portunus trituberculatus]
MGGFPPRRPAGRGGSKIDQSEVGRGGGGVDCGVVRRVRVRYERPPASYTWCRHPLTPPPPSSLSPVIPPTPQGGTGWRPLGLLIEPATQLRRSESPQHDGKCSASVCATVRVREPWCILLCQTMFTAEL